MNDVEAVRRCAGIAFRQAKAHEAASENPMSAEDREMSVHMSLAASAVGQAITEFSNQLDSGRRCSDNEPAWLPIDTAPMDGTEVIVGYEIATVWIARNARFVRADEWTPREPDDTDGWWSYSNSVTQEQLHPTHWCRMPKVPG